MSPAAPDRADALFRDCLDLARYIARARQEVARMRPRDLTEEKLPRAGQELDAIVKETEAATHAIMGAAEAIMAADGADAAGRAAIEAECLKIFEACSFQDITGQRIRKVVDTLTHIEERLLKLRDIWGPDLVDAATDDTANGREDAHLLNGPQLRGEGLDQSSVDSLFEPAAAPRAASPASQKDIDALFE